MRLFRLFLLAVGLGIASIPAQAIAVQGAPSEKPLAASEAAQVMEAEAFAGEAATTTESPFGELIRATGPMAKENPFRWSTKFWDEESGLVMYWLRAYSPSLGRWLNRDPIEEEGGLNLHAFLANDGVNHVDPFGAMTADLLLGSGESAVMSYENAAATLALGSAATILTAGIVLNNDFRQALLSSALDTDDIDYAIAIESGAREAMNGTRVLSKGYEGLIENIDKHIEKLTKNYPAGGAPDPNDPRDDLKRKWKKDLVRGIGNIKKAIDRLSNNALKRKPYEDAIKRADEILEKYGGQ